MREDDSRFTQRERTLIASARCYLERREHTTVDAYYRIRYTFSGIEVIAEYVSTYKDNERVSDKWRCVLMREDSSIIAVFPEGS